MINETINNTEVLLYSHLQNDMMFYTIVISAIIVKLKENSKSNIFTVWIMYLIGTFAHELAHLIASLFTNGKPRWFSIIPSKQKDENGNSTGYTLGYVKSANVRWYNVAIISLAPLVLMPLSYYVYLHFFEYFNRNLYTYIAYIFTIVSLLFSSIPSGVDFRNIFNGAKTIVNLIPIVFIIAICMFQDEILTFTQGILK